MGQFKYVAVTPEGQKVRGVVEGLSLRGARTAIMERSLEPVKVRAKTGLNLELTQKRVKVDELMHFSRQLSAFLRAGIPILDALDSLAEGTDNTTLERAVYDINDALRAGESFADAIAEHPRIFPKVYLGIIRSAEVTGNLHGALDELSTYLERERETRHKIRTALLYPSFVLVLALVVVVILATFVLPKFEDFFASLDAELPLITRLLLGTFDFIATWWYAIVAGGVATVVLSLAAIRSTRGRALWNRLVLRLPLVGDTVRYAIVERFCRMLTSMISAAVPLPEALALAGEGTNNVVYREAVEQARDEMLRGDGLAAPLAKTQVFPVAAIQMVRAGEETGTLDEQLAVATRYFEIELDFKIKRLTTLFEPTVIVIAGAVVGFVALALVSAMYGIFTQVEGF